MEVRPNGGPVKNALTDLKIVVERHSEVLATNHALPFHLLIAISVVGRVLSISRSLHSFLSLTASQLYTLELWRILTAPFVGRNILEAAITMACLHFGCTVVRQNNSTLHLFKIFFIVQMSTYAIVSLISLFSYIIFGYTSLLYGQPMAGLIPVDMSIMVLVKQFLPDSIVFTTPFGRLKYTHLPLTFVFLSLLSSLFAVSHFIATLQALVAMQLAWTYLRFLQPHPTDAIFGDNSDHFNWASLFPSASRPLMSAVGTIFFRGMVKLGLIRRQVRTVDVTRLQSGNMPAFEDSARDAERRRKLALQQLNERLARMQHGGAAEWPSDDEDENKEEGSAVAVVDIASATAPEEAEMNLSPNERVESRTESIA